MKVLQTRCVTQHVGVLLLTSRIDWGTLSESAADTLLTPQPAAAKSFFSCLSTIDCIGEGKKYKKCWGQACLTVMLGAVVLFFVHLVRLVCVCVCVSVGQNRLQPHLPELRAHADPVRTRKGQCKPNFCLFTSVRFDISC